MAGHQRCLELLVKALYHTIGLWGVSCSGGCRNAEQFVASGPKVGGELWSMVRDEVVRDTKPCDPVANEGSGTCVCCGVLHWHYLRPPHEAVDDRNEVGLIL